MLVNLWKKKSFLFQPKLLDSGILIFDLIDIINAKSYLLVYSLTGYLLKFKEVIFVALIFLIINLFNISIIKTIVVWYIYSYLIWGSLVVIKYNTYKKLISKKLIFERWKILRNGFLRTLTNVLINPRASKTPKNKNSICEELTKDEKLERFFKNSHDLIQKANEHQTNLDWSDLNFHTTDDKKKKWNFTKNSIKTRQEASFKLINLKKFNNEESEEKRFFLKKNVTKNITPSLIEEEEKFQSEDFIQKKILYKELERNAENLRISQVIEHNDEGTNQELRGLSNIFKQFLSQKKKNYLKVEPQFTNEEFTNEGEGSVISGKSITIFFKKMEYDDLETLSRKEIFTYSERSEKISTFDKKFDKKSIIVSEVNLHEESLAYSNNLHQKCNELEKQISSYNNGKRGYSADQKSKLNCNIIIGSNNTQEGCIEFVKATRKHGFTNSKKYNLENEQCDEHEWNNADAFPTFSKINQHEHVSAEILKVLDESHPKIISEQQKGYLWINATHDSYSRKLTKPHNFKKRESSGTYLSKDKDDETQSIVTTELEHSKSLDFINDPRNFKKKSYFFKKFQSYMNESVSESSKKKIITETNETTKITVCAQYEMNELLLEASLENDDFYTIPKLFEASWEELYNEFAISISLNETYKQIVDKSNRIIDEKFGEKLQEFGIPESLKVDIMRDLKKFKKLSEISAFVNSNFVSYYFALNKIIATKSVCRCNSYDLMQKNRLVLKTNQEFFHHERFEKNYNELMCSSLTNKNYIHVKNEVKFLFDYYILTNKYRQEYIINSKYNARHIKDFEDIEDFSAKYINDDFNTHGVNDMAFSNNMMKKVLDNEINRNINNAGFWDKYDFIEPLI